MKQPNRQKITERDRKMAQECVTCSLCRDEEKQRGMPLGLLHFIERMCPYRRGYEKVYGRKAHPVRTDGAACVA